jgi:hypothetical protein
MHSKKNHATTAVFFAFKAKGFAMMPWRCASS